MIGLYIETVDIMLEASCILEYHQFNIGTAGPIDDTLFIDTGECQSCKRSKYLLQLNNDEPIMTNYKKYVCFFPNLPKQIATLSVSIQQEMYLYRVIRAQIPVSTIRMKIL